MGYASKDERVVGELEGTIGTPYCFENVEVGCSVFNVVSLERTERKKFWRLGVCDLRVEEDDVPIPLYMESSME